MNGRQARVVSLITSLIITLSASAAFAQSKVRVVQDNTMIWHIGVSVAAGTVPAGTVLEVVRQTGTFYEVLIPEKFGGQGQVRRIAASSVEVISRSVNPSVRRNAPVERTSPDPDAQRSASPSPVVHERGEPAMAVRGFGQAGLMMPSARESFRTVAGDAYGFAFGGGAQVRFRNGLFVEGSLDQFRKTGERVFVYDDTVFPLGIPNTITVRPLLFTAGYRFGPSRSVVPYLGGGIGLFSLTERTSFSEGGESTDDQSTGYRMSGGLELRSSQFVSTALEAAYTRVPNSLGIGGVSQLFGERDLGGFEFRVKLLFGR